MWERLVDRLGWLVWFHFHSISTSTAQAARHTGSFLLERSNIFHGIMIKIIFTFHVPPPTQTANVKRPETSPLGPSKLLHAQDHSHHFSSTSIEKITKINFDATHVTDKKQFFKNHYSWFIIFKIQIFYFVSYSASYEDWSRMMYEMKIRNSNLIFRFKSSLDS